MQVIDDRQRFPYVFVCILTVMIIGFCYVLTKLIVVSPRSADTLYWYMARSAGFVSYGLLSLSVLLGASSSSAVWDKWKARKLMTLMHQYAALLVFPFLAFHLWGLYQDKSIPYNWHSLFIPFHSPYRNASVALGVLAMYGWFLIIFTSYLREKLGVKAWRTIHMLSFYMFIGVTAHGLLTGTDAHQSWARLVFLVPSALFVVLLIRRSRRKQRTERPTRPPELQR